MDGNDCSVTWEDRKQGDKAAVKSMTGSLEAGRGQRVTKA